MPSALRSATSPRRPTGAVFGATTGGWAAVGSDTVAGDYEYRGMMTRSWDLLRGDTSAWPDRPFWRAVVEAGGGPALDVG